MSALPLIESLACTLCGGTLVTCEESPHGDVYPDDHRLVCVSCNASRAGTDEEVAKAERSREAWDDYHRETRWKSGPGAP